MRRLMRQLGVLGLAILMAVAPAYANVISVSGLPVDLPGADRNGNLDCVNTGEGVAKITLNTRTGRLVLVTRGRAPNRSGKRQVFRNAASLQAIVDCVLANNGLIDLDDLNLNVDVDIKAFHYIIFKRGRVTGLAILVLEDATPT